MAELRLNTGTGWGRPTETATDGRAWYVLRVRSRSESLISSILAEKQIECFLPTLEERRIYSDRTRRLQIAAFPGYVFSYFDLTHRTSILSTPGVQTVVGTGGVPEEIDRNTIDALRLAFSRPQRVALIPYLRSGDIVRITDGPMAGSSGVLLRTKGHQRLVISVHLLQRSVAVEVDGAGVMFLSRPGTMTTINGLSPAALAS